MRTVFERLDRVLRKAPFKCREPRCPERFQWRCRYSDHITDDLKMHTPERIAEGRRLNREEARAKLIASFKGLPWRR